MYWYMYIKKRNGAYQQDRVSGSWAAFHLVFFVGGGIEYHDDFPDTSPGVGCFNRVVPDNPVRNQFTYTNDFPVIFIFSSSFYVSVSVINFSFVFTLSPIFWRSASGRLQLDGSGAINPLFVSS